MRIGIIGASLPGLVAAKDLMNAGHEVTVMERNRSMGGRMATMYTGDNNQVPVDYGISFLSASGKAFSAFLDELIEKDIIRQWTDSFGLYDDNQLHAVNPNSEKGTYYAAPNGMYDVARYLNRWSDIKQNAQAGGITFFGNDRHKKRPWMINMTDFSVYEVDAVIIAVPAIEAYALLQTMQDETPVRKIIRHIDEVRYDQTMVLSLSGGKEHKPEWKGLECHHDSIQWVTNETSKRPDAADQTILSIYTTDEFARNYHKQDAEKVKDLLLKQAAPILGDWIHDNQWYALNYWKYFKASNPMENSFYEMEMEEGPLALIGDYMGGTDIESAYKSAKDLTDSWISRYKS